MILRKDILALVGDCEWHFIGQLAVACWEMMSDLEAIKSARGRNPRLKSHDDDKTAKQLLAMSESGRVRRVRDICHDLFRDRMVHLEYDSTGGIHRAKLRPEYEWRHHNSVGD